MCARAHYAETISSAMVNNGRAIIMHDEMNTEHNVPIHFLGCHTLSGTSCVISIE